MPYKSPEAFAAAVSCMLAILMLGCPAVRQQDPVIKVSEFPLALGNEWIYEIRDSVGTVQDTVTVTAVGYSAPSTGAETSIWELHSARGGTPRFLVDAETLFVARSDSTIFFQAQNQCYPHLTLGFPLRTGNHWRTPDPTIYDSVQVVAGDSLAVSAGLFVTALRVTDMRYFTDRVQRRDIWIAPDVGIVRILEASGEMFLPSTSWELIGRRTKLIAE